MGPCFATEYDPWYGPCGNHHSRRASSPAFCRTIEHWDLGSLWRMCSTASDECCFNLRMTPSPPRLSPHWVGISLLSLSDTVSTTELISRCCFPDLLMLYPTKDPYFLLPRRYGFGICNLRIHPRCSSVLHVVQCASQVIVVLCRLVAFSRASRCYCFVLHILPTCRCLTMPTVISGAAIARPPLFPPGRHAWVRIHSFPPSGYHLDCLVTWPRPSVLPWPPLLFRLLERNCPLCRLLLASWPWNFACSVCR